GLPCFGNVRLKRAYREQDCQRLHARSPKDDELSIITRDLNRILSSSFNRTTLAILGHLPNRVSATRLIGPRKSELQQRASVRAYTAHVTPRAISGIQPSGRAAEAQTKTATATN